MVWVKVIGAVFVLMGLAYVFAAMGVEALENLTDSAGGPWTQGIVAIAIGVGLLVYAERKAKDSPAQYDHRLTNLRDDQDGADN